MTRLALASARPPATEAHNPHKRLAQLRRAKALSDALDALAVSFEIDPFLEALLVLTEIVDQLDEEGWATLTYHAQLQSLPSAETKALVRETYLSRARLTESKPVTRYSYRQPRLVVG